MVAIEVKPEFGYVILVGKTSERKSVVPAFIRRLYGDSSHDSSPILFSHRIGVHGHVEGNTSRRREEEVRCSVSYDVLGQRPRFQLHPAGASKHPGELSAVSSSAFHRLVAEIERLDNLEKICWKRNVCCKWLILFAFFHFQPVWNAPPALPSPVWFGSSAASLMLSDTIPATQRSVCVAPLATSAFSSSWAHLSTPPSKSLGSFRTLAAFRSNLSPRKNQEIASLERLVCSRNIQRV